MSQRSNGKPKNSREAILQSNSNEHYTPRDPYIKAVESVFERGIELDPASCAKANEQVRAEKYFTEKDDGLLQPWIAATLFGNPPYGWRVRDGYREGSNAALFTQKLVREYETGRVKEAIWLIEANTGNKWFADLVHGYPLCLVNHRIHFLNEHGEPQTQPTQSHVFVYLGPNIDRFYAVFELSIGTVYFPARISEIIE